MKKILAVLAVLVVVLLLCLEIVLPQLAQNALATQIKTAIKTDDVQVSLSSTPNLLVSLGRIDKTAAVAHDAKLGDVYVSELTLDGDGAVIDMPQLLTDGKLDLKTVNELTLKGTLSEDNLRELISRRDDKLTNIHVDITKERVHATAEIKVFGRMAEAEAEGTVLCDSGTLYFRLTRLNMKNALLGKLNLNNMETEIPLITSDKLPLGLKFDDAVLADGHVTVMATRDKKSE